MQVVLVEQIVQVVMDQTGIPIMVAQEQQVMVVQVLLGLEVEAVVVIMVEVVVVQMEEEEEDRRILIKFCFQTFILCKDHILVMVLRPLN